MKDCHTLRALDITNHWLKAVAGSQYFRAVSNDFGKAFNHVESNILVEKMTKFNLENFGVFSSLGTRS